MAENIPREFKRLTDSNGQPLITNEFWYNIQQRLVTPADTAIYLQFLSRDWANSDEAFFNLPMFDVDRKKRELEYELYLNKSMPPVHKIPCPRCGSTNVEPAVGKYTRALDEAGIANAKCRQCNKIFTPE